MTAINAAQLAVPVLIGCSSLAGHDNAQQFALFQRHHTGLTEASSLVLDQLQSRLTVDHIADRRKALAALSRTPRASVKSP